MKQFHIGDVLSVSTGCYVGPTNFGAVHALIEYMVGGSVFTHELITLVEPCGRAVLVQHPQLANVDLSGITKENHADRLVEQVVRFGEYLPIVPIAEMKSTS